MDELTDFDKPLFKILPKNDSGEAAGHQAGFLVPKDLEKFFPKLPAANIANPSVYQDIKAALFFGAKPMGIVTTRYQHQTWGGERTPERRVTGNLSDWQAASQRNDLLIVEQSLGNPLFYRFTIHKQGTPTFVALAPLIGTRRWGVLNPAEAPVSSVDIAAAEALQIAREAAPFELFDPTATHVVTRVKKIARSRAFQKQVTKEYDGKCCLCGKGLKNALNVTEGEAAHIVPRGLKGSDDARNGVLLCRAHHWAFDQGMFGVKPDDTIFIPAVVGAKAENTELAGHAGKKFSLPATAAKAPDKKALAWHLKEIVFKNAI